MYIVHRVVILHIVITGKRFLAVVVGSKGDRHKHTSRLYPRVSVTVSPSRVSLACYIKSGVPRSCHRPIPPWLVSII